MRSGIILNKHTGHRIKVTAATDHPSCVGRAVWVDKENRAYFPCDSHDTDPQYELVFDSNQSRRAIGQQIAELRTRRGLSTRELATLSGISYTNIGKIERGAYNVSIDILNQILRPLSAELVIRTE